MQIKEPIAKRKFLPVINSIYDLLGWAYLILITAKIIFCEIYLRNVGWDHLIQENMHKRWNTWVEMSVLTVPRCITAQDYQ